MKTSWEDFRKVFVEEGGWNERDSKRFFDQWLTRQGGPKLKLENLSLKKSGTGWKVSGAVTQNAPFYDLDITLALSTPAATRIDSKLKISGGSSPFVIECTGRPDKLVLDPGADVFRLLDPEEIPATVNSLKGSDKLIAVLAGGISADAAKELKVLLEGLNKEGTPIFRENEVDLKDINGKDVLFFGFPQSEKYKDRFSGAPPGLKVSPDRFSMDGSFTSDNSDCLFIVLRDPAGKNLTALFLPSPETGEDAIARTARKITHYGQYSYLSFAGGTNRAKGAWETSQSPLVFEFGRR